MRKVTFNFIRPVDGWEDVLLPGFEARAEEGAIVTADDVRIKVDNRYRPGYNRGGPTNQGGGGDQSP